MTRRLRVYFNNSVYHVCIRGNNRQRILEKEEVKIIFLRSLSKFKLRFGFKVYALVIMDNHLHLIIQATQNITISKIMHAVTLSFSVKFRKKYRYTGYVWQGRFKSNVIDGDNYILSCIEYIHNNPVRARIAPGPQNYPWSSYHFYHSQANPLQDYIAFDRFRE
jgi:putative transposase